MKTIDSYYGKITYDEDQINNMKPIITSSGSGYITSVKARELRIGNWVKWQYKGADQYSKMDADWLALISKGKKVVYPIALAPEILNKAGFETTPHRGYENPLANFFRIYENLNGDFEISINGVLLSLKYKYLHQIQNLYFALIGEELEINLSNESGVRTPRLSREQIASFSGDIPKIV